LSLIGSTRKHLKELYELQSTKTKNEDPVVWVSTSLIAEQTGAKETGHRQGHVFFDQEHCEAKAKGIL
jgi:hypothetical protein